MTSGAQAASVASIAAFTRPIGEQLGHRSRCRRSLGLDGIAGGVKHASPLACDLMVEPSAGNGAIEAKLSPRCGMWPPLG